MRNINWSKFNVFQHDHMSKINPNNTCKVKVEANDS